MIIEALRIIALHPIQRGVHAQRENLHALLQQPRKQFKYGSLRQQYNPFKRREKRLKERLTKTSLILPNFWQASRNKRRFIGQSLAGICISVHTIIARVRETNHKAIVIQNTNVNTNVNTNTDIGHQHKPNTNTFTNTYTTQT